jgi:nicotinate-nucleotide pyrophosphorylase (carboxylating)
VFRRIDPDMDVEVLAGDGTRVSPGDPVMEIEGSAASILTAERVALNFLQRLSGTATITAAYVAAVRGTGAAILDTRKTTPGMRALEKAAVLAGGGRNHRFGLHDMVLIKENHIAAAGGIPAAVARVREHNSTGLEVEVEVTTEDQIRDAIAAGVDRILLDNMAPEQLRSAVGLARELDAEVELEASGGVTLHSVREIASCGVDFVSVGALTHSAPALDLSLLLEER